MAKGGRAQPREPLLEWIAAGVGLALTLLIVAVIGREAVSGEADAPPAIEVRAVSVARTPAGFVVEVAATNRSGATAAAVQVEGELSDGGTAAETASLTFDYVPGHATRTGGLFFSEDPRKYALALRALGYQEP